MFKVESLSVSINGSKIIHDLSIEIKPGEVHAIMGPNGSGKSTLSKAVLGDPRYDVDSGRILLGDENLLDMAPEERAVRGVFIGLQYPVEIPGVSNQEFLRMAYNARMKFEGRDELDPLEFNILLKKKAAQIGVKEEHLKRSVNHGFSGGEKKRNEILQMAVLEPKLIILDEVDSGLDIDALRSISESVNEMRGDDRAFLIITHYRRLLDLIKPDHVHILGKGRIVRSGDISLADELEAAGYAGLLKEAGA